MSATAEAIEKSNISPQAKAIARGVNEMAESLTGFEEVGIKEAFGAEWSDLGPTMTFRALLFVQKKREGLNHQDAYNTAMEMKARDVQEVFVDDDEPMPEEPVTEPGKGDSLSD